MSITIVEKQTAKEHDGFILCMVGTDQITEYAWGVPMKSKTPEDVVKAVEEVLHPMGIPKQLYSDQEGAFRHIDI